MPDTYFPSQAVQQLHAATDASHAQLQCREALHASSSIPATPDEGVGVGAGVGGKGFLTPASGGVKVNELENIMDVW